MKILKFGGTSVGSIEAINATIAIISDDLKRKEKIAVVLSAFSKVTDSLIEMGNLAAMHDRKYLEKFENLKKRHLDVIENLIKNNETIKEHFLNELHQLKEVLDGVYLIKELSLKSLDFISSFGERFSNMIISYAINERAIKSEYLDARKLVKTDNNFGNARVDFKKTYKNIKNYFAKHQYLQIITGFIGSTDNDETVTLGRGGSDYTASIFGGALNAEAIEVWTDVDGVLTCDPRKVKDAFQIKEMNFEEIMEMAHFGAKVVYPPTMRPAKEKNIPIWIKNTFNPKNKGTVIKNNISKNNYSIKGISSVDHIAFCCLEGSGLIGVAGISARLFSCLAKQKISVIFISQASSEHSICFAIDPKFVELAKQSLYEEFEYEIKSKEIEKIVIENDLSIIAIVGENMKSTPGICAKLFGALGSAKINVIAIAQGSSERNISLVIAKKDLEKALNVIHNGFFNNQ